ncbi:MAG TPA: c-type cytochrome, partial [Methyloceanibacter sp.]|nr:c-type cytochrome [Methyloceanibacter sp.]
MKHYRLNQIAMAVLGALLLIFGTRTLVNIAFEEHEPEKPGMEVAGAKHGEKPGEKPAAAPGSELPVLLAKADATRGETAAAICKACHALEKDAPSPIGPNLHNVVGRKIASVEGFTYSPALKAKAGEDWTYEHIDAMIHKPADYAPGTMMAFPGLADAQQRADVILFLRTKTDSPPPLPEVAAVAPDAAPAGEAAKPAADPNIEVAALVAKADPAKGEGDAAICKACHAFEKGAPSPVGPNLYGVLGRKIASVEGFNYTPAMKAHAEETWDYAHVDRLIHKPAEFAPGTMMAFPGLPDANQRAEVIAFLRTKADSPYPLPEAAAAKPESAPAPEAPKAEEPAAAPEAPKAEATPAPEAPKAEEPAAAPAPAPEEPKASEPAEVPAPAAESTPAPAEEPAASPAP